MWLTQTYLQTPGRDFPAYAYFLFNPYTSWDSDLIRAIRNGLRALGRMTEERLAILMPDEDIDRQRIGEDLDTRFSKFVEKIRGQDMVKGGLLVSDTPLERMSGDGSNARWVYFGFDEFIKDGRLDGGFDKLIHGLVECANSDEGDTISRFVAAFRRVAAKRRGAKLAEATSVSISLGGPSIGVNTGKLAELFKSSKSVRTNCE
ncbi:MAG: hypothetical protein ACLQJR_14830 [Stellaceae bacterium]